MKDLKIFELVTRITDGDNVPLEDAIQHLAEITERPYADIERIFVTGAAL